MEEDDEPYCFMTWLCGCAATTPPLSADISDEERVRTTEWFDHQSRLIGGHLDIPSDCHRTSSEAQISPEARKRELLCMAREIQSKLRDNSIEYIRVGQRYHSCLLKTRMRNAKWRECGPAHRHFAISNVPRHEDPFFGRDDKAESLITRARKVVEDSDEEEDVKSAMRMVNAAFYLSCLKTQDLVYLRYAVELIESDEEGLSDEAVPTEDSIADPQRTALPGGPSCAEVTGDDEDTSSSSMSSELSTLPSAGPIRPGPENNTGPTTQSTTHQTAIWPRDPNFTWPMQRWSLYRPRGLVRRDPSSIKSRKLSCQTGRSRANQRERLFQKMIYGKWMKRVEGPRYGMREQNVPDLYAIWP